MLKLFVVKVEKISHDGVFSPKRRQFIVQAESTSRAAQIGVNEVDGAFKANRVFVCEHTLRTTEGIVGEAYSTSDIRFDVSYATGRPVVMLSEKAYTEGVLS